MVSCSFLWETRAAFSIGRSPLFKGLWEGGSPLSIIRKSTAFLTFLPKPSCFGLHTPCRSLLPYSGTLPRKRMLLHQGFPHPENAPWCAWTRSHQDPGRGCRLGDPLGSGKPLIPLFFVASCLREATTDQQGERYVPKLN